MQGTKSEALRLLHDAGFPVAEMLEAHPLYLFVGNSSIHGDLACAAIPKSVCHTTLTTDTFTQHDGFGSLEACWSCTRELPLFVAIGTNGPWEPVRRALLCSLQARESVQIDYYRTVDDAAQSLVLADRALHHAESRRTAERSERTQRACADIAAHLAVTRAMLRERWSVAPNGEDEVLVRFIDMLTMRTPANDLTEVSLLARRVLATWPAIAVAEDQSWVVVRGPASVLDQDWFPAVVRYNVVEVLANPAVDLSSQEWSVFAQLLEHADTDAHGALRNAQAVLV